MMSTTGKYMSEELTNRNSWRGVVWHPTSTNAAICQGLSCKPSNLVSLTKVPICSTLQMSHSADIKPFNVKSLTQIIYQVNIP